MTGPGHDLREDTDFVLLPFGENCGNPFLLSTKGESSILRSCPANRMASMIEIKIASDPRLLVVVRAMIGQLCEVLDCPPADQHDIVLAVDEACSNIIKHTYHGDCGGTIEILCKGDEDKLEIVLLDCGPPMDIARCAPRSLSEVRPGGLGTHFIRSIMDEVVYGHRETCGNVLRMVKHFHRCSS